MMYMLPELYGTRDYLCDVTHDDIDICKQDCVFRKAHPCDEDVFEMCSFIMHESNLSYPVSIQEALDLYITLRQASRGFLGVL
jgi:hypothetical protein